jgi:hypothetical protein
MPLFPGWSKSLLLPDGSDNSSEFDSKRFPSKAAEKILDLIGDLSLYA